TFNLPQAVAAEKSTREYQPSALMVVESKDICSIIASKRLFRITTQTKVFGPNGKEITIRDLPVPCEAKVQYEPLQYDDPTALKIVVKNIFPGASTDWSTPLPE
ncbi:hypothetical protein KJ656_02375, partial [bacterium]|nr:hypothetical protein [bacterium]